MCTWHVFDRSVLVKNILLKISQKKKLFLKAVLSLKIFCLKKIGIKNLINIEQSKQLEIDKKELIEIIDKVETTNFLERNNLNPSDYYFLTQDNIDNLPYLPDDSKMSNINSFEFEIPKEDKEFLIERVKLANELLNE